MQLKFALIKIVACGESGFIRGELCQFHSQYLGSNTSVFVHQILLYEFDEPWETSLKILFSFIFNY
jgi:hypothetical protein